MYYRLVLYWSAPPAGSGGIKLDGAGRGAWGGICPLPEALSPHLPHAPPPPSEEKKWSKSTIFGRFQVSDTYACTPLVFEVGYHSHKKKKKSRKGYVYAHRLGGAKRAELKKKVYFWSLWHFVKENSDRRIKKRAWKNAYSYRVYFVPEKYMFRVCFENRFMKKISSLQYKCPPGPPQTIFWCLHSEGEDTQIWGCAARASKLLPIFKH